MPTIHNPVLEIWEAELHLETIDCSERPEYIVEQATLNAVLDEIGLQYLSEEFLDYEGKLAAYDVLNKYGLLEWHRAIDDVRVHIKLLLERDCMALERLITLR